MRNIKLGAGLSNVTGTKRVSVKIHPRLLELMAKSMSDGNYTLRQKSVWVNEAIENLDRNFTQTQKLQEIEELDRLKAYKLNEISKDELKNDVHPVVHAVEMHWVITVGKVSPFNLSGTSRDIIKKWIDITEEAGVKITDGLSRMVQLAISERLIDEQYPLG